MSNEKELFAENFKKSGEFPEGGCKSRMSFESVLDVSAANEYNPERGLKSIDSKQGEEWSLISANNGNFDAGRIKHVRDNDNFTWR